MSSLLDRIRAARQENVQPVQSVKPVISNEQEIMPVKTETVQVVKENLPESSKQDSSLSESLKKALLRFGYTEFRKGQEEALVEILQGTKGVLVVFPTGLGKSILYQIPPLITGKLTVVVSPLISLMRDQVAKLQKLGINAIFINSTVPIADVKTALLEIQTGGVSALYVAPERFNNPEFMKIMQGIEIDVFALDEVHCISKCGNDFRPAYAELGGVIERLKPRQVVALTATATPDVQDDVCRVLGIEGARRFISGLHRKNLRFMMFEGLGSGKLPKMADVVTRFVKAGKKTGLVYSQTRKEAEEICEYFGKRGIPSDFYHAGLKDSERTRIQDKWTKEGGVIVATCAFGMGIDRADVRFVIHSGLSPSIEDAIQEFGRAGRDGEDASCISFWDMGSDYRTQMFLIDLTNPSGEDVGKFWNWIRSEGRKVAGADAKRAELNMTQKVMGEVSRCVNVGGCISILKSEGLISTVARGKYEVVLDRDRKKDISALDSIRQGKIDKLNQIVNFYKCKECRVAFLCDYFGDMSFEGVCGVCDNCLRG